MEKRKAYPSDLTEKQWEKIMDLLPKKRTSAEKMREYLNAIFYVLRTGCSWRMLPHDFPSWSTVYDFFQKLSRDETWQRIHDSLRDEVRQKAGRESEPSVLIADSQSVKTTEKGANGAMMVANTLKAVNDIS